ncbi:MAG: hypothetical protein ACR2PT_22720 [Endozoicomonas sp.]
MACIRTLLEPFDRETLLLLLEEMFDDGRVTVKEIRHFAAMHLEESARDTIPPEVQLQVFVSNIVHHQTDSVTELLESFWKEENYRQGFEFLMTLTRLFTRDWRQPEDDEWFYRHWEDAPKEVEDYTTFVMFMDDYLAKAALMAELEELEVMKLYAELENLNSPADCAGGEAEDYLGDEGYRLEKTLLALNDNWSFEVDEVEFLIPLYLDIYDRWGQHQDYLDLAKGYGFQKEFLLHLVKQGKVEQVMGEYSSLLKTHDDCLELIQALFGSYREQTVQVAAYALALPVASEFRRYESGACFRWLSKHLEHTGDERALQFSATDLAMEVSPELDLFKRRETHTPSDAWAEARQKYLDYCMVSQQSCVDILIYAAEFDLACEKQQRYGWFGSDLRSSSNLKKLKQEKPEWVMAFAKAKAEERIAETKVESYPVAASILDHARALYVKQGRAEDWKLYLQDLISTHKRKRKLVPLLQNLEVA